MNIISDFHIFFTSWAFVGQLRPSSEELGNRLQTPTLIGCKFLKITKNFLLLFVCFTVISEALNYDTVFSCWSTKNEIFSFLSSSLPKRTSDKNAPGLPEAFFAVNSLTMTYFHTGTRTIIGAEAFHCAVRDGKEWYHFAMVVRHNFFVWLTEVNRTNL